MAGSLHEAPLQATSCPVRLDSNSEIASPPIDCPAAARLGFGPKWERARLRAFGTRRTVTLAGSPDRRTPRDRAPQSATRASPSSPRRADLVNILTIFSAAEQRTTTLPITARCPGRSRPVPSQPGRTSGDGLTGAAAATVHAMSIVPERDRQQRVLRGRRLPPAGTKSINATLRWDVAFTLQGSGRSPWRRSSSPTPSSSTRAPPAVTSTTDATPGGRHAGAVQLTTLVAHAVPPDHERPLMAVAVGVQRVCDAERHATTARRRGPPSGDPSRPSASSATTLDPKAALQGGRRSGQGMPAVEPGDDTGDSSKPRVAAAAVCATSH